jgi:hypothetical protein
LETAGRPLNNSHQGMEHHKLAALPETANLHCSLQEQPGEKTSAIPSSIKPSA